MKILRFDQMPIKAERDGNGFLVAPAAFTRVGVFYYVNDDGSVRAELRLAEEVFSPETLASLQMLPVTNDHPPEMVNPQNSSKYVVGFSSEQVKREGDIATGFVKITDAACINAIENGDKTELSCGYVADLEYTSGVWEGIRYDAIQRNIRYNHIAVVQKGRAGASCRIKTDSADVRFAVDKPETGGQTMAKVRLDGVEVEVTDIAAQLISKEQEKRDMSEKEIKDKIQEMTEKIDEYKKQLDSMSGKKDAAEANLAKVQAELEQAKKDASDMNRISELVKARAELISKCQPLVSSETKLDTLSDSEIKRAVVASAYPEMKLDGASDDRIDGLFEGALLASKSSVERQAKVDDSFGKASTAKVEDLDKVHADAREATYNKWQATLAKK
jgi:uncharacterized protein